MSVNSRVLSVIGTIYDATTDETLWPKVLEQLLDVTDSQGATFCVIDGSDKPRLPTFFTANFESHFIAEYLETMVPHDPTVQHIVSHPEKKIIHDAEFITEREKDKHFYYDWHHRFSDTRHRLAGMVNPTPKVQSGVTLHRTRRRGNYEPADVDMFKFLYGHLERAVHIGFRLGTLGAMQQATFALIDANPLAIVVLDERGCVLFSNRAAQTLASAGDGVAISSEGISLGLLSDDHKLQELIGEALALGLMGDLTCATGPSAIMTQGVMRALRPSGKRPYAILVSPLSRVAFNLANARPSACVVIADPERRQDLPEAHLRQLYGLTRSEARLATLLAGGEELRAAAMSLGIGYPTARTQLAAIFRKTETRRQGELVKLLLSCL